MQQAPTPRVNAHLNVFSDHVTEVGQIDHLHDEHGHRVDVVAGWLDNDGLVDAHNDDHRQGDPHRLKPAQLPLPMPRDDRIVELSRLGRRALVRLAVHHGWLPSGRQIYTATTDELRAMILDAETTRGEVAP